MILYFYRDDLCGQNHLSVQNLSKQDFKRFFDLAGSIALVLRNGLPELISGFLSLIRYGDDLLLLLGGLTMRRDFSSENEYTKEQNVTSMSIATCEQIGLQGSGFLQVAEIFSSMAIMDNALNVLLIDEPDSHISPRIQNKLLNCLKEISNVQVFVITHNDNFVSELDSKDIIFINSENKNSGHIEALNDVNIDVLHNELGGVITGLTRLQKNKHVIFMEGEDDIAYLKALNESFQRVHCSFAIDFSKISFWYVRGKDNMNLKIMANKQLLSQAL